MSKKVGSALLILIVLSLSYMGYRYIHFRIVNAVSDAAFIKTDRLASLSFKVGGRVVELRKEENALVHKGELLARIEPIDLLTAKKRLVYKRDALIKKIEAAHLKKQRLQESLTLQSTLFAEDIEALRHSIAAMELKISAAKVRLKQLKRDCKRLSDLLDRKLIGQEKYEKVLTEYQALSKSIEAMERELLAQKAKLAKAKSAYRLSLVRQKEIKELSESIKAMREDKKALLAAIEDIEHKISYTKLYAPFDGVIAKKFFDAPKIVKKGSPVYALSDPKALYCQVLLSEKKLMGVKPGNRVEISVDALEGKKFTGVVESIAPTSASTFSLVPRDIASGEFTKLDQRFSVRIKLDKIDGLRAGMGASVAIKRSRDKKE